MKIDQTVQVEQSLLGTPVILLVLSCSCSFKKVNDKYILTNSKDFKNL